MRKLSSIVLLATAAIFLFGAASSKFDEPAGQKVFVDQKCMTCHSVEPANLISKSTKKDIPDLSKIEGELDADFLKLYLMKKEKLHDKDHPMAFKGSEDDLASIVDWIIELNKKLETKESEQTEE